MIDVRSEGGGRVRYPCCFVTLCIIGVVLYSWLLGVSTVANVTGDCGFRPTSSVVRMGTGGRVARERAHAVGAGHHRLRGSLTVEHGEHLQGVPCSMCGRLTSSYHYFYGTISSPRSSCAPEGDRRTLSQGGLTLSRPSPLPADAEQSDRKARRRIRRVTILKLGMRSLVDARFIGW